MPVSTRAQVVAVYFVLLVAAGVLIVLGVRQVLTIRLTNRINEDLRQEIVEVTGLVEDGRDPLTAEPFRSLDRAFDVYLNRNVPNLEEAFVTFVGGQPHGERLERFPGRAIPPSELDDFAALSSATSGPQILDGTFDTVEGQARFRAARLALGDERGVFVVVVLPRAAVGEIRELQTYGAAVTAGVVLLAAVAAYFLAGLVLAPVRALTGIARSVSEVDRSGRIPARGTRETIAMADSFNAMLDRLELAHRSQLDFLRAAGHELRTPLTVAMGHLGLMHHDSAERQAETTALVLDELARMGRIVDDLQSLAESDHPTYVIRRPFELGPLAADLLAKASALGSRVWELDATAEGTVEADRDRLVEAMLNLADNAVKNSDPGDTIGIGVSRTGTELLLWVRDTGSGIHDDDKALLFQRFSRGRSATRRYRGIGLGLAVVLTIVEAHSGRVEVESRHGTGSRFTLKLPIGGQ